MSDILALKKSRDFWWACDKDEMHDRIWSTVRFLDEQLQPRWAAYKHFLRLYSNRAHLGFKDYAGLVGMFGSGPESRIRLNVVKSAIDASIAYIGTEKARPMYSTFNAPYSKRKMAEGQTKFVAGQFYANKQYQLALDIYRDACIFGVGYEHPYEDPQIPGRICVERISPFDYLVDEREAKFGYPRQHFRLKPVDRSVLIEMFPDKEEEILQAVRLREEEEVDDSLSDDVTVIEAYHLPSGPEADDGKYCWAISTAVLECEGYTRQTTPYIPFRWNTVPESWYGIGAAEELSTIQIEINYIAQKIQDLMTLAAPSVFVQKGSGINKLNNRNMGVYEYSGRPPIFQSIAAISAEYFLHLDRLYNRAFEIVGISQLQAQSKKPAGLDSGEALKVYHDIGSARFKHIGERWAQFHLDIGEEMLRIAREIEERGDGEALKVLYAGDRDVEEIKFSDVMLEENKYTTRVYPTSFLPDEPAGKVDAVVKLAQALPDKMGKYMLGLLAGVPDLDAVAAIENAPLEIVESMVELILEEGKVQHPYPEMDKQLALSLSTKHLLRAITKNYPEERIELLQRFILEINQLIAMEQPPMPAAATAMPGPMNAPAMPMPSAPPMSEGAPIQ